MGCFQVATALRLYYIPSTYQHSTMLLQHVLPQLQNAGGQHTLSQLEEADNNIKQGSSLGLLCVRSSLHDVSAGV